MFTFVWCVQSLTFFPNNKSPAATIGMACRDHLQNDNYYRINPSINCNTGICHAYIHPSDAGNDRQSIAVDSSRRYIHRATVDVVLYTTGKSGG